MIGAENVDGNADEIEHDRRHIEHVVGPVTPAGEETVEVSENLLGPEIDSTFARVAMSEFDDGDALRPEEEDEGDDPKPDGDAAVRGDRRDDIQVEHRDNEKQHQVPFSKDAFEVRGFCWSRAQWVLPSSPVADRVNGGAGSPRLSLQR